MKFIPIVTVASLTAGAAFAQHAGDVFLEVNSAGRIITGLIDEDKNSVEDNVRVFGSEFGEFFPDFTDEPGFDSEEGTFAPGSGIGFTIRRALRKWDGVRFPAEEIPAERIQIRLGALGPVFTPTTDAEVVGFIMPVNSEGGLHHHPGYTLLAPASEGIYLLEIDLWSTDSEVLPSKPIWIVFNQEEDDEIHDDAMDWVYKRFVCPADFNMDRTVDFFDYLDFVQAFADEDPSADVNDDGQVDFFDYLDFVAAFGMGCDD